jgi:hypothetical protein
LLNPVGIVGLMTISAEAKPVSGFLIGDPAVTSAPELAATCLLDAWRRAPRRGEQAVQSGSAIYLTALPGQLELETSSGCAPVNAAAAVVSPRS